jgi:hypothetical protein
MVPDQDQDALLLGGHLLPEPGEDGRGDMAHRAPLDKAQQRLRPVGAPYSLAAHGFGIGGAFG